MANEQNDGRNPPKLDRVNVGDAITADAWNQIVDRLNKPLDVSIRRPKRQKGGGNANPQEFTYATAADSTAETTGEVNPLKFATGQFYVANGTLNKKTTAYTVLQAVSVVNNVLRISTQTVYL